MTCASCGATIADKAIVCYRCGAPTAVPHVPRRAARRSRRPSALIVALVLLVLILLVLGFVLTR